MRTFTPFAVAAFAGACHALSLRQPLEAEAQPYFTGYEFEGVQTLSVEAEGMSLTASECGGAVSMEPFTAGNDLQQWLMYSKDTTLQGDYVLINKGLMDCPEESYLLAWDGCGSTSVSLGTFADNSLWRVRPRLGGKYKYENISDTDKKCLAVSNYLEISGEVTADYFGSGDFQGAFEPKLFKT